MSAAHERAMLGIAADLLQQGRTLHGLSVLLTGAAALILGIDAETAPWSRTIAMILSASLGAAQTILAVRTGLDAALFRRLADGLDLSAFDSGMTSLGLLPAHKTARSVLARISGAKRLLVWQAAALAGQGLCFGAALVQTGSRIG